jgi:hypothetical protein
MPFAGYDDFEDCVRKNKKKGDAKAYCATIMRKVEGARESVGQVIAEKWDRGSLQPPKR